MLFSILTEKQGSGARFLIAAVLFVAVSMLSFLLYQQKVDKKEIRSFLHYASKIIFVLVLFDMTYISLLQKKFTAVFDFEILVVVLSLFGFIALQTYLELEPPSPTPITPVTPPIQHPPQQPCENENTCPPCEKNEQRPNKIISLNNAYVENVKINNVLKSYNSVGFVGGLNNNELYLDLTTNKNTNYRVRIKFKKGKDLFYVSMSNHPKPFNSSKTLEVNSFQIHKQNEMATISPVIAVDTTTSIPVVEMTPVVVLGYRNIETQTYLIPVEIDEKISKVHIQLSEDKAISLSVDTTNNSVKINFPDKTIVQYQNNYIFSVYHETE